MEMKIHLEMERLGDPAESDRRKTIKHLGGGGKRGGRIRGDIIRHYEKVERGRSVHIYAIASGYVWGDGKNSGGTGGDAVVGESGYRPDRG